MSQSGLCRRSTRRLGPSRGPRRTACRRAWASTRTPGVWSWPANRPTEGCGCLGGAHDEESVTLRRIQLVLLAVLVPLAAGCGAAGLRDAVSLDRVAIAANKTTKVTTVLF